LVKSWSPGLDSIAGPPEYETVLSTRSRRFASFKAQDLLWGRDHSEDLGIDGKIILEWILRK